MKKRFSALLVVLSLLLSFQVFAEDKEDKEKPSAPNIEISLEVGSNTININGTPVEVETPYVLNGTTLVPLRVITEAFGAEVVWDAATQSITLKYADVTMVLKIGEKAATVNAQTLQLLEAPEIKNDKTMVPFRFITENFGADVTYDEATQQITVVKQNTYSNSIKDYALVLKRTQKSKIGDSFWNWSMKIPKTLALTYRSFDGRNSMFSDSIGNTDFNIYINVSENKEDATIEQLYAYEKDLMKDYTLVSQETKKGSDGLDYITSEYKTKTNYIYNRMTIINGNIINIELDVINDDKKDDIVAAKKECTSIIDSFTASSINAAETEDLSDAKDGFRIFDNKALKVSLKVPANYNDFSDEDIINEFEFMRFDKENVLEGRISLGVYSKDISMSLEDWANRDREYNRQAYNSKFTEFTEVSDMVVNSYAAKYYKFTYDNKEYTYDVFVTLGDYRYNIAIKLNEDNFSKVKEILDSFTMEKLDAKDIGKISNPDLDLDPVTRNFENKSMGYSMDIPMSFKVNSTSSTYDYLYDDSSSLSVSVEYINDTTNSFKSTVDSFKAGFEKDGYTLVEKVTSLQIDSTTAYKFTVKKDSKDERYGTYVYHKFIVQTKDGVFLINAVANEKFDGEFIARMIEKIIKSIKLD